MSILCPTCRKEMSWKKNPWRPFCSDRCKLLDLGAWADGTYRIEGRTEHADDGEVSNGLSTDES